MSDHETKATTWNTWIGGVFGAPVDPIRPKGEGWRLIRVLVVVDHVIGYWEREVKS